MTDIEVYENEMMIAAQNGLNSVDKGDICVDFSRIQSISYENDKLSLIDDTRCSGISCRVFNKNKVGNASTNDLSKISNMLNFAYDSAQFGEESLFMLPKKTEYVDFPWLHNKKNLDYTKEELNIFCQDLLSGIKKIAPQSKVSVYAQIDYSFFYLQNTEGFLGSYRESSLAVSGGLFDFGSDGSFLEIYEELSFYDQELDFLPIFNSLEERWILCNKKASPSKEGPMPVIFAPSALELLIDPVETSVNGKTLEKKLSFFEKKKGELVASTMFNLYDDPCYLYGSGSVPFDDEGVCGISLPIIEAGVFRNFIYDCSTAYKEGTESTGHGFRLKQSLPSPAMTNKIIGIGDVSLNDMIQSIEYGFLVESVLGEGQSNVIAGDFSVLSDMVYLIQGGVVQGRVKNVMFSGNAFDLLKKIVMIENKLHKESNLFAPHILVDGVSVSYKN